MASLFSAKRRRDDSDDELDRIEGKRLRTLPLRESPTSRRPTPSFSLRHFSSKPPSLVPGGESSSGSDESSPEPSFVSPGYPARPAIPTFVSTNADTDMDYAMADDDDVSGSPMWSPKAVHAVLGPSPAANLMASPAYPRFLSASADAGGAVPRAPTPIMGSFAAARPTRPAGLAAAGFSGAPNALSPIPAAGALAPDGLLLAHDPLRRRRPLPSPISEDTSSPTTMMRDLDMGGGPLTASTATFPGSTLTPVSPVFVRRGGVAEGSDPASTAFRRRRSDAISGGESGGGKVVFSMGYRADCEKCREKVPGHYSHVLRV